MQPLTTVSYTLVCAHRSWQMETHSNISSYLQGPVAEGGKAQDLGL